MAGFIFVQALNIVRIISLFYLDQWNYTVFEWFHPYLWPVLLMPTFYADFGACPPLVLVIASVAAMEGPRC